MEDIKEMDLETIKDLKNVLLFARNRFENTLFMWECENDYLYRLLHNDYENDNFIFDTIAEYVEEKYANKKWTNSLVITPDLYSSIIADEDIIHHIIYTKNVKISY